MSLAMASISSEKVFLELTNTTKSKEQTTTLQSQVSVEPVDENTKENLQKTIALAIEITTKRQESIARHNAEKLAQDARGKLEKMMIDSP